GARAVAVDAAGNAYVTGATTSKDFPTTPAAYDRVCGGSCQGLDVFVAKLNPQGSALVYGTYLGGASQDEPYGIAVDGAGQAIVAGQTTGSDFPVTAGA